jgi:hypothetical protein
LVTEFQDDDAEIIECELRLHSGRPTERATGELTWADWSETVVGEAITFRARADTAKGLWSGPLAPGIEVAAPVALDDPYWTVFLPSGRGVPILVGQVGHPLAIGESFHLPPGRPGVWTTDVTFEGAIVTD